MKLESVSVAFSETLEMGIQITCMALIFIYHVIWGQKCSFLDTGEIRDRNWNREKFTVFVIRHDLESDHRVLGEDNLTVVKILEGEHIVVGVGLDRSGHSYFLNEDARLSCLKNKVEYKDFKIPSRRVYFRNNKIIYD